MFSRKTSFPHPNPHVNTFSAENYSFTLHLIIAYSSKNVNRKNKENSTKTTLPNQPLYVTHNLTHKGFLIRKQNKINDISCLGEKNMTVQNLPVKSIVHGDKILPSWMIKKVKTKLKDKFIPLYLTSDRHIINGLSRFYAAVELGYDKVPCVILEEKEKEEA